MKIMKQITNINNIVEKQEKFLKNPSYIIKFLDDYNIADELIVDEINGLSSDFSKHQSGPLKNNMSGKLLTPKNFIIKIISDYILSPNDFIKSYNSSEKKHLTNFLLKKKIEVIEKDGKYFKHYIQEYDADLLPFLIKLYPYVRQNEFKMKYEFKNKNFVNMALSYYFKQVESFPKIEITINKKNSLDLLNILDNPYIMTSVVGHQYFLDYNGPDSPIYDHVMDEKKYIKIYFPRYK